MAKGKNGEGMSAVEELAAMGELVDALRAIEAIKTASTAEVWDRMYTWAQNRFRVLIENITEEE